MSLMCFIDFSKAFDIVDHLISHIKFSNDVIKGTTLKWFEDLNIKL